MISLSSSSLSLSLGCSSSSSSRSSPVLACFLWTFSCVSCLCSYRTNQWSTSDYVQKLCRSNSRQWDHKDNFPCKVNKAPLESTYPQHLHVLINLSLQETDLLVTFSVSVNTLMIVVNVIYKYIALKPVDFEKKKKDLAPTSLVPWLLGFWQIETDPETPEISP